MSVEQIRGRLDCGLKGVAEDVSPERFRGLRINLARPVQVGAVQTCRGSHTHSVVSSSVKDGAEPVEIAYFDRGPPIDAEDLILGGFWSTYWYHGRSYGTEIVRGLDVLALVPFEHLSEHEIAAAAVADQGGVFNPQQQFRVHWPAEPVVARAYLDQLERGEELSESLAVDLAEALGRSAARLQDDAHDEDLAAELETLAAALEEDRGDAVAKKRRAALGETPRRTLSVTPPDCHQPTCTKIVVANAQK